nr:retrovirus-related Pol polyprotein from transposon TNT 1-94 [Tanacetum cinerariifolium]
MSNYPNDVFWNLLVGNMNSGSTSNAQFLGFSSQVPLTPEQQAILQTQQQAFVEFQQNCQSQQQNPPQLPIPQQQSQSSNSLTQTESQPKNGLQKKGKGPNRTSWGFRFIGNQTKELYLQNVTLEFSRIKISKSHNRGIRLVSGFERVQYKENRLSTEEPLSAKHQLAVKGLFECKASESNIKRIQVKDIVKEVKDYLKTYSSAVMYIIWDTKIAALRLKFNVFKAFEGEKVNGTYTRLKCLLNDLENNGVNIPQAEVNATIDILTKGKNKKGKSNKGKIKKGLIADSFNWDNEFVSSEDEGTTKFKAFMAIAEDEPSVGKVPSNIVKALGGKGKKKENNTKEVVFAKDNESSSESAPMITSDSEDDYDNQEPLPTLPKLVGAKPSVSQTYVIKKRSEPKLPDVQVSCPDKNVVSSTMQLLLTLMKEVKGIKEQIKTPSDTSSSAFQASSSKPSKLKVWSKTILAQIFKGVYPKVVFRDNSSCNTEGYGSVNYNGITFTMVAYVNERRSKTLIKAARTMLNSARLPKQFWGEAVNAACYTQNRSIIMKRQMKTAYEENLMKVDNGFFLGYSPVAKVFRVFNIRRQEIEETFHVTFSEDDEALSQTSTEGDAINFNEVISFLDDEFIELRNKETLCTGNTKYFLYVPAFNRLPINNTTYKPINVPNFLDPLVAPTLEETPVLSDNDIPAMDEAKHSDTAEENQDDFQEEHRCDEIIKTQPSPQIHSAFDVADSVPPFPQDRWSKVRDLEAASAQECLFVNFLLEIKSKKLIEALKEEGWVLAMTKELNQFERNHVWTLVPKPCGKTIIGLKWVFRNKSDVIIVQIYVDDIIFESTSVKLSKQFDKLMTTKYQANPKESHLVVVKGIFWYLKGTLNLGFWYPRVSGFDLKAYSDSEYASCNLDQKSTTGGCQILKGKLVCWSVKKQSSMAMSSAEAKYVVIASCCAQVRWIKSQLANYDVYYDKKSSISVALTKQPSPYYAKYLREFWYTAKADMQTKSITFTLSHLDKPLSFDLDTFSSIIRLKSNDPYVSMPQKETVKEGLATLGLFNDEKPAILSSDLIRASCVKVKYFSSIWKVLEKIIKEEVAEKDSQSIPSVEDLLNEADKRAKADQLISKSRYDTESKIRVVKSFINTNLLEQLSDSELSDMPDDDIHSVSEFENVDSNVKSGHEVSHSEYHEEDFHADESYAFAGLQAKFQLTAHLLVPTLITNAIKDQLPGLLSEVLKQCRLSILQESLQSQIPSVTEKFAETQSQLNKKKELTNALQSKISKLVESKVSSEMEDVRDALQTQSKHIQSYCQGFQTMQSQLLDITDLLQLAKQTEKPKWEQPEVAKGNEENSLIIHTSKEKKETKRIILEDNSDDELDKQLLSKRFKIADSNPTPLKTISPEQQLAAEQLKKFTDELFKTTSSIYSHEPPREPTPPRDSKKGKEVVTDESQLLLTSPLEEGEAKAQLQEIQRLANLKKAEEESEKIQKKLTPATYKAQALKCNDPLNLIVIPNIKLKMLSFSEWIEVLNQAKKVGLPPPPELATFGMTCEDKKRKRTEFLKVMFVTEDIRNTDVAFQRESKFHLTPKVKLIRIHNQIRVDSEIAKEMVSEMNFVIEARNECIDARNIV